jgi:hypothetical protein
LIHVISGLVGVCNLEAMTAPSSSHDDSAEALRERAQWYRDYAKVGSGDTSWCLRLAGLLEAQAAVIEATRDATTPRRR